MAIQIIRNENGNCIEFRGSSNPVYWNACLSAEVDPNDSNLVNVINDIHTAASGEKEYEFYHIPYTEWRDADNNPFASAQEVADYITLNGNVAIGTDITAGYEGVWDADTNTPDLTSLTPNNGDWFYVNVAGTYNSVSYNVNDVIKWNGNASEWQLIPNETVRVDTLEQSVADIVYSTESGLFNTNASVYADGDRGIADPNDLESGWYYRNETSGIGKINWYYVANMNPENTMNLGTLKGMYAVIKVLATGVPYFSVYTQPTGQSADAASWYRSRLTYLTDNVLDAYVGQQVLLYWGEDPVNKFPTLAHIEMELEPSTSVGPAGTDENILFGALSTNSSSPEGEYEFIGKTLGYKNNNHIREYQLDTNDPVAAVETTDVQANTAIDFTRDATNTSVILSHDGSHYGVNTIKAVREDNGTISIKGIGDNGEPLVTSVQYDQVTIAGLGYSSIDATVNALNAHFTVNPYGVGYEPATILPITGGLTTTLNLAEGNTPTTGNPTHLYVAGSDTSSGHGARAWTNQTINQAGEFFDVKLTGGIGRFIIGLADVDNADRVSELNNNTGTGHSGLTWGNAFYDYGSYTSPWTWYGAQSSSLGLSYGPGWNGSSDAMMRYNQEVQDNLDNMDEVLFRCGISDQGHIYVSYYDAGRTNQFIMTARSGNIVSAGTYALVVKLWSGNTTLVEAPVVHHVLESAAPPTALGDSNITVFGDGISGDLASGVIADGASSSDDNDGFVSQQSISSSGEYFELEFGGSGDWVVGLFDESAYTVAELDADRTPWGNNDYVFFGVDVDGNTGVVSFERGESSINTTRSGDNSASYSHVRVGFDLQGRAHVWVSPDGVSFTSHVNQNTAAPAGSYRFIAVAQDQDGSIISLEQGVLSSAPVLSFRYIESPDGNFQYPLFATQEEADYYEEECSGSDNGSHSHVFPDDASFSTWWMPNTCHEMNGGFPPAGTDLVFQGQTITYTEIPSQSNADLVPSAFSGGDHTFNENSAVSIQITPADAQWTTSVSGLPQGLVFDGTSMIQGTTNYVPRDESYTVTVTRTNNYGSSNGTFVININDNASLGDFTGFSEIGGNLVQPNRIVLDYDALLQYDTTLSQGEEITYTYSGGQIPPTIGILNSSGEIAAASHDSSMDDLGTVSGNNFAETGKWDLRYVTFGGYVGGSSTKFALVGWSDNVILQGAEGLNVDVEFKLEYGTDGYIRLYRGGVLLKTSLNTFNGDQTITLAGFDDQQQANVYIPTNWTVSTTGAGSTTAPTGFASPLTAGTMASTTILGGTEDSAATFTATLEPHHRYIFPRAWVETNILPHITESGEQVVIGVPVDNPDFVDISLDDDFFAGFRLTGSGTTSHNSYLKAGVGSFDSSSMGVGSMTDAFYDYAIEWDGTALHVIACNINDINTQPGVAAGGNFSRTVSYSNFATQQSKTNAQLSLVIAVDDGGQAALNVSGIQQIRIPFSPNTILVGEASNGAGQFGFVDATSYDIVAQHAPPTLTYDPDLVLNAGEEYNFIYSPSLELGDYIVFKRASDGTNYTDGVVYYDGSSSGDPDYTSGYKGARFTVPSDAPPLNLFFYNSFSGAEDNGRPVSISGSTYTVPVTGVTQEGPAANQTGSNMFDQGDHGWISIDDQLGAGERLVMDGAFLYDLVTAMPDGSIVYIGLKDTDWTDALNMNSFVGQSSNGNYGGLALTILRNDINNVNFQVIGADSSSTSVSTTVSAANQFGAFIDITSSGNNVRIGFTYDGDGTSDDEGTTPYSDWGATRKIQTGDKGYGLTSVDVVILASGHISGNAAGMDSADVDWTGLSEIAVPTPAVTNSTSWTKALDFSGSSERAQMVSSNTSNQPIAQPYSGTVTTIPAAGYTTSAVNGRPWACACVFKIDGNSSNQHIWNQGEGAGDSDDNIYLRLDAAQNLYFGWGRSGAVNECRIATAISSGHWYGIYVAHDGRRYQGGGATPGNLYTFFDIRLMSSHDGFATSQDVGTYNDWNQASSTTGGRMDRVITGDFTIGGRGANRNFHGTVASFVSTTLKINQLMPSVAEAETMITDPMKWIQDYKVGQTYRQPNTYTNSTNWQIGSTTGIHYPAMATQVWLMGDNVNDSYTNMIRNVANAADQNYTKLNMISMVSNDIQTVSIPGLT